MLPVCVQALSVCELTSLKLVEKKHFSPASLPLPFWLIGGICTMTESSVFTAVWMYSNHVTASITRVVHNFYATWIRVLVQLLLFKLFSAILDGKITTIES